MYNSGHTLMRWLNASLLPLDKLFHCNDGCGAPPIFIVGAPRSGTTLAYQIITQQLKVAYFTILHSYLYGASNLIARSLRHALGRPQPLFKSTYGRIPGLLAPAENGNFWFQWFPRDGAQGHFIDPAFFQQKDYRTIQHALASLACIFDKPMVFKSTYLCMVVGTLAQILEHARFVFIRRDPFFTCQSLLLARKSQPRPHEWWSVRIPGYRQLLSRPLLEQVAEQVCTTERIVQNQLMRFAPNRYREVRYEDLCRDPRRIVREFSDWLAPSGYEAYEDFQVPRTFQLSSHVRLDQATADAIRQYLHESKLKSDLL